MRPTLEAWEKLCAEHGTPPANVALAWLLRNPAVTAPIIGPRTVEQLDGAMGALDVQLDDEMTTELDRIFPGPGGAAPEADRIRLFGEVLTVIEQLAMTRSLGQCKRPISWPHLTCSSMLLPKRLSLRPKRRQRSPIIRKRCTLEANMPTTTRPVA